MFIMINDILFLMIETAALTTVLKTKRIIWKDISTPQVGITIRIYYWRNQQQDKRMNDTTIHIEDFTPVANETKLMPCQSCGMLRYFNLSNMNTAGEMFEDNFNSSSFIYTCITCFENYALAQQVHDL